MQYSMHGLRSDLRTLWHPISVIDSLNLYIKFVIRVGILNSGNGCHVVISDSLINTFYPLFILGING